MKKCLKCLKIIKGEHYYGLHKSCFLSWFNLKTPCEFVNFEIRSDSSPKRIDSLWNSSFFHGNYKKYSASLGKESYILKVREDKYPELPDVEYVCNQIAILMELPVAKFYILELMQGERVFVTQNFCRTARLKINLNHIYKYLSGEDNFDCETLINILVKETKRYADIETFIGMCIFDSIVGNHDRHGRNIGLLVTSKGTVLSPMYDNPSCLGLESGKFLKMHWSPKGKIFTKKSREPTSRDYVEEFLRLGYSDVVKNFYKKINVDEIKKCITQSFCSSAMKNAILKLVSERVSEIKYVLEN